MIRRCVRPLIGKIPIDILRKYEPAIYDRMSEYADNTGKVGMLMGFVGGFLLGMMIMLFGG